MADVQSAVSVHYENKQWITHCVFASCETVAEVLLYRFGGDRHL